MKKNNHPTYDESRRQALVSIWAGITTCAISGGVCTLQWSDGPLDAHAEITDEIINDRAKTREVSFLEAEREIAQETENREWASRMTALTFSAAGLIVAEGHYQDFVKLEKG